jgi:FkbM family methyltransferase
MRPIKDAIRAALRQFGYEVRRVHAPAPRPALQPGSDEWWRRTQSGENRAWLEHFHCRTVVDAGASVGDFSALALRLFPDATVHAFEPLAECQATLNQRFQGDQRVKVHAVALGAERAVRSLLRSAYAPSSSLLPMAQAHTRNFPFTRDVTPEQVRVERLDDVLAPAAIREPLCIKLDVQGYEGEVIEGGRVTVARAAVLIVEMSLEPLYEAQPLFDAIYRTLVGLGFEYAGNLAQLLSPDDGRVLQVDAVFRRRGGT